MTLHNSVNHQLSSDMVCKLTEAVQLEESPLGKQILGQLVENMDIAKIHIEYAHKSGVSSATCNGSCHTKVLPYLSVVQAVEGSYDIQLDNGKTYNTGNGGFFIAPSNVQQRIVHNVNPTSKKMVCRWRRLQLAR